MNNHSDASPAKSLVDNLVKLRRTLRQTARAYTQRLDQEIGLVMEWAHVDLHKISLGSLIIALGLLVDDAIIIIEMTVRKLEEGYDRLRASTYAFSATAMPMLTGTLITAAGFLPIGIANSAVGEYTFAIFAVTTAALLISWLVSIYFVPFLGFKLLRDHPGAGRRLI